MKNHVFVIHISLHVRDKKRKYYYTNRANYEGDKEVAQALWVAIQKCIKKRGIKEYVAPPRMDYGGNKMKPHPKSRRSSAV